MRVGLQLIPSGSLKVAAEQRRASKASKANIAEENALLLLCKNKTVACLESVSGFLFFSLDGVYVLAFSDHMRVVNVKGPIHHLDTSSTLSMCNQSYQTFGLTLYSLAYMHVQLHMSISREVSLSQTALLRNLISNVIFAVYCQHL